MDRVRRLQRASFRATSVARLSRRLSSFFLVNASYVKVRQGLRVGVAENVLVMSVRPLRDVNDGDTVTPSYVASYDRKEER